MDNNRDAHETMNGFFYQRYCCIYYILINQNFEYILEEGYEDIDLIKIKNMVNKLNQLFDFESFAQFDWYHNIL